MSDEQRYDVIYRSQRECDIEPHFCREWDESGGCYGFNPEHGFNQIEALEHQIQYYINVVTDLQKQRHDLLQENNQNELV